MLRNPRGGIRPWSCPILNEVLSLNAQEFFPFTSPSRTRIILNEVLSLNAQEYLPEGLDTGKAMSSMKS